MLLEIKNLTKIYKGKNRVKANDNISLAVSEGEVFGLLGPNGAGKTTLVNQIIGLAVPTSGTITISGVDVIANPDYARQACSFQAQVQAPISGLAALQAIELVGRIRGGKKADVHQRALELIEKLELGEWQKTLGLTISGGVRRLVAFCMAAVVPGRIVILDEPTNDVDPLRRRAIWQEVQELAKQGAAVLLVTHNILEAERVVDRLAIVDQGVIKGMGTPGSLKESEGDAMRLELTLEPKAAEPSLPEYLKQPLVINRRVLGQVQPEDIPAAIAWARGLKESGDIEEFSLGPATLEDVYVRLVKNPNGNDRHGKEA
ncbi:MAG: ABC transporter ATP-binding protein [Dehalococcoidales bacterium]|jgi:ABC-2 type transport system ATP-binding protein